MGRRKEAFPLPAGNIHWVEVRKEPAPEVEERRTCFVHYRGGMPDAVISWSSTDAVEAQQWLRSVAFKRCFSAERGHADCGIRLSSRSAANCGNHKGDR